MSRSRPVTSRPGCRRRRRSEPEPFDADAPRRRSRSWCPVVALAAPAVLRLLPGQRRLSRAARATTLSTGPGRLGLAWQSSPALTEIEEVVTDWMRQMLGLSARERRHPGHGFDQHTRGADLRARESPGVRAGQGRAPGGGPRRLSSTCPRTATARSRRPRCSRGLGASTCVPSRSTSRVRGAVRARRAAIQADLAKGRKPSAVVGTTGTTTLTAFDRCARSPSWRSNTASGCTWMPRWRGSR